MNFLKRVARYLFGILLCQTPITSLLVVGWMQDRMQRVIRTRTSTDDNEEDQAIEPLQPRTLRSRLRDIFTLFKRGTAAAANLFIALLPATGLWYFAWVLGWNISFHKQYEQSHLGASLGWIGIVLFAGIMLYLPTAIARQASENNWRAFWRFKENWRIARRAPLRQLLLASGFAMVGGVVMVAKIAPYFIGTAPEFATLSAAELTQWLNRYYLAITAALLPAYVLLWNSAARVYATASTRVAASTEIANDPDVEPRSIIPRFASFLLARSIGTGAFVATMIVWILFSWQVFVGQFFNYIPGMGWLNHPLLVLPWVRYLPPGL